MTDREAYIALNMIDEVGPVRVRALLEQFGTPAAILAAGAEALRAVPGVGPEVARNIARWRETIDLEGELKRLAESDVRAVIRTDAEYPRNLREIYDPPLALYVRGTLADGDPHAFAVVGSRRATLYGQEMSRKLAFQLVKAGLPVVSGLARGIDTAAHTGALQAKGRTVAVIGSGLDKLYPPENRKLADQIVAKGGAVVSEFPFGVMPDRQHFPMRNRIISGWSIGVLVVEAGAQSGALISARFAGEQGRQVFAVPGRADSPLSRGANKLIKDGAKLTEDIEDILAEYEYLMPKMGLPAAGAGKGAEGATAGTGGTPGPLAAVNLSEPEARLWEAMTADERSVDDLIQATGLTAAVVSATLLGLEMKRLVRSLPGQRYARRAPVA